jgi:hypothetical protein
VTWALVAAWASGVTLGFAALERHRGTPGERAEAPERWPEESRVEPSRERATLVLFAHPKCPCTRATLGELEAVLARSGERVRAHVLFVRPSGVPTAWERTDLWSRAAGLPGVLVASDEGGVEATRFGARTSGHVVLYDRDGTLRFAGGITGSRGHAGDNAGRSAVEDLLAGRSSAVPVTPVFGCPLLAAPCGTKGETCPR